MTRKALGGIVASILGIVVACAAGATLLFGGGTGGACTMPMPTGSPTISAPPGGWRPVGHFDAEQVGHAATITVVGAHLSVPIRGWIIAVATAIQESDLRNLPGGPDDSTGLFQQRPSQGWGTPDQLRDPVYAAGKFHERLLTVANWQQMALTDAAQAVQRSAYPDAYADDDEPDATLLVSTVGSANWQAIPENPEQCVSTCPVATGRGNSSGPVNGCSDGEAVLARAATWLTTWNGGPVPYLSSDDPTTWFGGYRRDCSGYASMALGLPGPGLTTAGLAARATRISKTALSAGNLLINPAPDLAGHVVIFDHWTDATMTSYVGYEQSGD